jgi:Clr5 domain
MAATKQRSDQADLPDEQARSKLCPFTAGIDWEKCKKDVETYYCKLEWPLRKVMEAMKTKYNLSAT